MRWLALFAFGVFLAGCSTLPNASSGWIEPAEAIRAANDDPTHGSRGYFVLTVKAIGSQGGWTYLNSEKDYRDQRCLTIAMPTSMVPRLEQRLGIKIQEIGGRRIVVLGVAKRTRIDFFADGHRTDKYYYQTHIQADSPTQFQLADSINGDGGN